MYPSFFGLREFPFNLTPDIDFAYRARPYQEALNTLLLALDSGAGFLKVTGEVGTVNPPVIRCSTSRRSTLGS